MHAFSKQFPIMESSVDPWHLDPQSAYVFEKDAVVRRLMRQLNVPNLFAQAQEHDAVKILVAFDNHPTHWIIFRLWKGAPDYSPNHSVHKFAKHPEANGLLFEATPKQTISREKMEIMMTREAQQMDASGPFRFSQLPPR